MIRSIWIYPFLYRLRTYSLYKPFTFPEGCRPNVSDPTTFETNYSVIDTEIENMLNFTLANDSIWEEVIVFDKDTTNLKYAIWCAISV